MGLFSFLSNKAPQSVVLIDVDSGSVGGAYAHISPKQPPRIYFTVRLPIERTSSSLLEADMLRTLQAVIVSLVEAGAPVLRRETGSGHVATVLASIGSPWQQTHIEVKSIEKEGKPFSFTKAMMDEAVVTIVTPEGRVPCGRFVIATLLNGYETNNPFGKRAKRADLIVLSSSLATTAAKTVREALRGAYHTNDIELTGFAPLVYTVFRDLYPHEKDFLVVDFSGEASDFAFVKGGLLVDVASIPSGAHQFNAAWRTSVLDLSKKTETEGSKVHLDWVHAVGTILKDFAKRHALPRTLFVLASHESRELAKKLLDSRELHALWLSDEPLRIIPVLPAQFSSLVETRGSATGDATLALLSLFFKKRYGAALPTVEASKETAP